MQNLETMFRKAGALLLFLECVNLHKVDNKKQWRVSHIKDTYINGMLR